MKILVTGGCGYIGSHTTVELVNAGFDVISIDNYINSEKWIMDKVAEITGKKIENYDVDLRDYNLTKSVFEKNSDIAGVIHFAALKAVGESVEKPLLYYENNLLSLINILKCMEEFNIDNLIFSSSCTVYGNPEKLPVTEDSPIGKAESPYGATKVIGEEIIKDFSNAYSKKVIALRYFNPVGAHMSAKIGELPKGKPSNLIPVITQTAIGKIPELTIFGNDYDTKDGTCVRDYIHVSDVADAHVLALKYLQNNSATSNGLYDIFNLGTGDGVSVLEMVETFESVNDIKLNYKFGPRRAGDVIATYADNSKIKKALGWKQKHNLADIMKSAWEWEKGLGK
jgi:UDP-glucose 4-epimerase